MEKPPSESATPTRSKTEVRTGENDERGAPEIVDRTTFQAELGALRLRKNAHTREGDIIAAARRRLRIVEVNGATPLIGERGAVTLLDAFEGRLTRYRVQPVRDRSQEVNRLCKVLEDAGLKLTTVITNVMGKSGRAMLQALVDGTTDPVVLAELARGKLRKKLPSCVHEYSARSGASSRRYGGPVSRRHTDVGCSRT
ncbi:MAG TPA: DUF899 family protein [Vicinamibacterales bacterium]|nr:DUF899 family protein [Vicinamibacterales bacterium]